MKHSEITVRRYVLDILKRSDFKNAFNSGNLAHITVLIYKGNYYD